jgi:hypothetical protein
MIIMRKANSGFSGGGLKTESWIRSGGHVHRLVCRPNPMFTDSSGCLALERHHDRQCFPVIVQFGQVKSNLLRPAR